jgi:hypothetical protein
MVFEPEDTPAHDPEPDGPEPPHIKPDKRPSLKIVR